MPFCCISAGALPFFLTFKQALALGGCVRKGAKGHPVVYYNISLRENQQTGKEEKMPFLKYSTVFSVEDIEGINFNLPVVEEREHLPTGSCRSHRDGVGRPPDHRAPAPGGPTIRHRSIL